MTTPNTLDPLASGGRIKRAGELDPLRIPGVGPRGVIPVSLMQDRLRVEIPLWLEPSPFEFPHILTLYWVINGKVTTQSMYVYAPPPSNPDPIVMYVPRETLREQSGVGEIYYSVETEAGTLEMDPRLPIRVDMVGPTLLRPQDHLEFVVAPTFGVDEAYIAANKPIRLRVPPYNGREDWDYVEIYASNSATPPVTEADAVTVFASSLDQLIAELDGEQLRKLLNGPAYLFYRVFDEAKNFSTMSAPLAFDLALTAPPSDLKLPQIKPDAYEDGLINRRDARLDEGGGVFVRILAYTGWASGDSALVHWRGSLLTPQPVVSFPCDVPVPWLALRGTAAVLAAEEVPVYYEIKRGTQQPPRSRVARFKVNLTIAGQENPNAPAKLNALLALVEIRGQNPPTVNVIDNRHRGQDVLASVKLFDDPKEGHVLRLYSTGAAPVATYVVKAGDVAGQIVSFSNLPWSVFEGIFNSRLPFYYTTDNGVNEQRSRDTEVDVNAVPLIMMPAPKVQHTLTNGYLKCTSTPYALEGVNWLIEANSNLQVNDEIRFKYEGFKRNNWEDLIAEAKYSESIRWTVVHVRDGLIVTVKPYEIALYPMRDYGSANASYEVWRNGVPIGKSSLGRIRIDLKYGTGHYCSPAGIVS
ncbi:MAG: hypothetical protein ACK418_11240 [Pseudomonas sp.]|uniref:hypothetical protein n=1 Tax=Pseudomonas sp. TaxID=306 RepID=UPI0039194631